MDKEALDVPADVFTSPLTTPGQVLIYALKQGLLAAIFSPLLLLAFLPVLHSFDVMPQTVTSPVLSLLVMAWIASSLVTGILAYGSGRTIYRLSKAGERLERLNRIDALSGLLNRRGFQEVMSEVAGDASLAILDIDRFKSINERYGHAAGDTVIERVGSIIVECLGDARAVARLNGEEFAVIIASGDAEQRLSRIRDVCRRVGESTFKSGVSGIRLTISAGVADMQAGRDAEAVYRAADKALYLAKTTGRNRVLHERELQREMAPPPMAAQRGAA